MLALKLLTVILFFSCRCNASSKFPDATITVFSPRGLLVSIPDVEGITSFTFHGQFNAPLIRPDTGLIERTVLKPIRRKWTFYDPNIHLNIGDKIYYWMSVQYKGELYHSDSLKFKVNQTTNDNASDCKMGFTTSNQKPTCPNRLIFHETFDTLNSIWWTNQLKNAGKPDHEFVTYTPMLSNITNGFLRIQPIRLLSEYVLHQFNKTYFDDICTGDSETTECFDQASPVLIHPPICSSQITTENSFTFKYGVIEIRARLPKGDWLYPELYLQPATQFYGPDYQSGQLRIAFVEGNAERNHILKGGGVIGNNDAGRNFLMRETVKDVLWSDAYHVYSLLWLPDRIEVAVDDVVYGRIMASDEGFVQDAEYLGLKNVDAWRKGTKLAPFDKEMFIVIGVGSGGHNIPDRWNDTKPWRNGDPKAAENFYLARNQWLPTWTDTSMFVDYVKVWSV